jgi:hypothetical protein
MQILKEKQRNSISISLSDKPLLRVYIDRNLMDKYTFNFPMPLNLLQQRKISIVINEDKLKNQVKISFKDSGIGIRKMN